MQLCAPQKAATDKPTAGEHAGQLGLSCIHYWQSYKMVLSLEKSLAVSYKIKYTLNHINQQSHP